VESTPASTTEPLVVFVRELLRLVEEAESIERFDDLRAVLRESLTVEPALSQANEAYAQAVRLRETLLESRQREIELRGLIDTASDLAALHDPQAVLAAICRRVRSLLGTDAAWITLLDPERGDTYHCMTDGILGDERVRQHRLSKGTGLGGLVLETGQAEWTDDYLADRRFAHKASLDRTTVEEGLGAMLGAPMKHGDELLGIVITGNRSNRRFVTHDVTLLQTLADLAAVAIINARLHSASRAASLDLRKANEQTREQADTVARSAELHTRLSRLVLDGMSLEELLQPVAELMDGHVAVVDANHRVLAAAGEPVDVFDRRLTTDGYLDPDAVPAAVADALERAFAGEALEVEAQDGHQARSFAPMLARHEPLGALILTKPDVATADLLLLQSASLPLALFLSQAQAHAEAERVVRGELLDDLITNTSPDVDALLRRAHRVQWEIGSEFVVAIVAPGSSEARWIPLRAGRLAAERGGLMTEREGTVVLLLPGSSPEAVGAELMRAVNTRDEGPPTIALARPRNGIDKVPAAYTEARQALVLSLALNRSGTTVLGNDDAYGIIFGSVQPGQLDAFIQRTLGPVLAYDEERNAGLLTTLEAWFEADGHMLNTATAAHIHVNTLYKRMERVDALLGRDWRSPDERLQVQLALRLRRLAGRIGADGAL
jgi:sugar diacid utilization regulator/GAF domain-containing protein